MRKLLILLALASSMVLSTASWAAEHMKPGLWEMTVKSDMMKNMPKIPPEQMEQMRKMGIKMPTFQDGGMTTKVCISRQMAERDQPPAMNGKSGCDTRNFHRSGSNYSVDIVCDSDELKGEGKAKGTFSGSQSFTSTYDFKGTAHGHPVDQHSESAGKWLSADCGDVQPLDKFMPKK